MNFLEQPVLLVLVGAIPSAMLGYLGYRRSLKVDKATDQNNFVDNLQQDNEILRKWKSDCDAALERVRAERDELRTQCEELRKRYNVG